MTTTPTLYAEHKDSIGLLHDPTHDELIAAMPKCGTLCKGYHVFETVVVFKDESSKVLASHLKPTIIDGMLVFQSPTYDGVIISEMAYNTSTIERYHINQIWKERNT